MDAQTTFLIGLSCAVIILIAIFGNYILGFIEALDYEEPVLQNAKPIIFPCINRAESYSNILQQIDHAQTDTDLTTALIDIYIFSGSYKDSDGFKNILLDAHFKRENKLKNLHLN